MNIADEAYLETCDEGHKFYKMSADTMRGGCPACLRKGLQAARYERDELLSEIADLRVALNDKIAFSDELVERLTKDGRSSK